MNLNQKINILVSKVIVKRGVSLFITSGIDSFLNRYIHKPVFYRFKNYSFNRCFSSKGYSSFDNENCNLSTAKNVVDSVNKLPENGLNSTEVFKDKLESCPRVVTPVSIDESYFEETSFNETPLDEIPLDYESAPFYNTEDEVKNDIETIIYDEPTYFQNFQNSLINTNNNNINTNNDNIGDGVDGCFVDNASNIASNNAFNSDDKSYSVNDVFETRSYFQNFVNNCNKYSRSYNKIEEPSLPKQIKSSVLINDSKKENSNSLGIINDLNDLNIFEDLNTLKYLIELKKYVVNTNDLLYKNIANVTTLIGLKNEDLNNSEDLKNEVDIDDFKNLVDISRIREIVDNINVLLKSISRLSNKGYVNDVKVDLPILRWFISEYKLVKTSSGYSIFLNTLFFNLVLLLLFEKIITIEKHYSEKIIETGSADLIVDLITLRKSLLRMINPNIKDRITSRGLSVILSSIVGYDSEYELNSSSRMINDLLSIQLAGSTGVTLKIPIVSGYNKSDLKIGYSLRFRDKDESFLGNIFHNSISNVVKNIRKLLFEENDLLLIKLKDKLIEKGVKNVKIDDYWVFTFDKSDVKTFIKYTGEYTSKELIIDSDSLNNNNHRDSLYKIIELLNDVCKKEMSNKLIKSIDKSSNKRLSRITYRHGDSRLSITTNRVLYICMHESAADLSILKDFDTFKENLDIVSRAFVTLGKPLTLD